MAQAVHVHVHAHVNVDVDVNGFFSFGCGWAAFDAISYLVFCRESPTKWQMNVLQEK
jgi:hypothetical protein